MTATERLQTVLVDDEPDLRLSVKLVLERDGRFEVVGEGGTGEAAIEQARRHRPDLMLLDLSMPKMDGLEALPVILSESPETQVIVFSGFVETRLWNQVSELGAVGYLEKGVGPDELVGRIIDILEGRSTNPRA